MRDDLLTEPVMAANAHEASSAKNIAALFVFHYISVIELIHCQILPLCKEEEVQHRGRWNQMWWCCSTVALLRGQCLIFLLTVQDSNMLY